MIRLPPSGISISEDDLQCHLQRILLRHTLVASFSRLCIDCEDCFQEDARVSSALRSACSSADGSDASCRADSDPAFANGSSRPHRRAHASDNGTRSFTGLGAYLPGFPQSTGEVAITEAGLKEVTGPSMSNAGPSWSASFTPNRVNTVTCQWKQAHSPDGLALPISGNAERAPNHCLSPWNLEANHSVPWKDHRPPADFPEDPALIVRTTPQWASHKDTYFVELPLLRIFKGVSGETDSVPVSEVPVSCLLGQDKGKETDSNKLRLETRNYLDLSVNRDTESAMVTSVPSQLACPAGSVPDNIENNKKPQSPRSPEITSGFELGYHRTIVGNSLLRRDCRSVSSATTYTGAGPSNDSHVRPESNMDGKIHRSTRVNISADDPPKPENASTLAPAADVDQAPGGMELRHNQTPEPRGAVQEGRNSTTYGTHVHFGLDGATDDGIFSWACTTNDRVSHDVSARPARNTDRQEEPPASVNRRETRDDPQGGSGNGNGGTAIPDDVAPVRVDLVQLDMPLDQTNMHLSAL
ncbi:hypothetical protein MAP00_002521 [Monascus purpureus]|nr:hypothetical protein MAP00_002521 [Monascus purpureus]